MHVGGFLLLMALDGKAFLASEVHISMHDDFVSYSAELVKSAVTADGFSGRVMSSGVDAVL